MIDAHIPSGFLQVSCRLKLQSSRKYRDCSYKILLWIGVFSGRESNDWQWKAYISKVWFLAEEPPVTTKIGLCWMRLKFTIADPISLGRFKLFSRKILNDSKFFPYFSNFFCRWCSLKFRLLCSHFFHIHADSHTLCSCHKICVHIIYLLLYILWFV